MVFQAQGLDLMFSSLVNLIYLALFFGGGFLWEVIKQLFNFTEWNQKVVTQWQKQLKKR